MHLAQDSGHFTLTFQNCLKGFPVCLEIAEWTVNFLPMIGNEAAHLWGKAQVTNLGVLEEAHQAVFIFFEDVLVGRINTPVPSYESVEFLAIFLPES